MSRPEPDAVDVVPMQATVTASLQTRSWRLALPALVLLLALILWLYRDTAMAMVMIWYRSETFTHGFVVLPIALWLIWRRRPVLALLTPKPSVLALLFVAGLAMLWLLGDLVAVNSVTQFALVALLVVSVPAIMGLSVAKTIAFPLTFIFFGVPIGEFMMPQLMDWTADMTIFALRLSGIPVFREGLNFVIPSGSWSVVEACSGVRYLIASVTVGTLYAYLNYQSTQRRLLFILVSILVPVVANWLRAYMIVMIGHLSGNSLGVGVDHLIYGWLFFGVVILLMFIIGARWTEPDVPLPVASASMLASAPGDWSTRRVWLAALVCSILVVLPIVAKDRLATSGVLAVPQLVLGEAAMQPWQPADAAAIGFRPNFENPSAELNRAFAQEGHVVGLYLGYYRDQDYERKLVSSTNMLVKSADKAWSQVESGSSIAKLGSEQVTLRSTEMRRMSAAVASAPQLLLAWQVYWINGRLTSNDYLAKIYSAANQLLGRGDDSALIVVYTSAERSGDAAASLGSFLSTQYGAIDAALRDAAGKR